MKLAELLQKENNNLDVFRLAAACFVIYGHAYAIAPQPGHSDIVARMLGHDYSGSLAVKVFFFLSGLVVTNSLLQKQRVVDFVIARVFRIWPGLIFVVILASILLGPLVTDSSLQDYWSRPQTYRYVWDNIQLKTTYYLPGVFLGLPHPSAVNGSLWTLPHEVGAYLTLLGMFMVGIFRSRMLVLAVFLIFLVDPLTGNKLLFTWRPVHLELDLLAPCFAMGSVFAAFKEQLELRAGTLIGWLLLYALFRSSAYGFYLFYVTLFWFILTLSAQPWMLKLKPKIDVSYGVYLWGFPVQQVIVMYFPDMGTRFNQLASLALALGLGWLSWHVVEKHGIAMGQRLIGWVRTRALA